MIRQKKYLRAKFGDVDEEMADDDKDKDKGDERLSWGGRGRDKPLYYNADNVDYEVRSVVISCHLQPTPPLSLLIIRLESFFFEERDSFLYILCSL